MKKRLTRAVTAILAAAFVLATIPAPEVEAALPSYTETFTGNIDEKIATEPEIKGVAVSFKADFDTLLYKVNTQYQPEVSKFCSILATDVYETTKVTLDGYKDNPTSGNDDLKLVKAFGFTDPQVTKLEEKYYDKDKNDLTRYLCAHRSFEVKGKTKEVILVAIEGTNGTEAQWSSNMDVGADTKEYQDLTGDHPEWTNKDEHKGFNVAYNRMSSGVKHYIEQNVDKNADKIILITGHSRGGALANLLGKEYEDNNEYTSFTYTFAAPNTTVAGDASKYKTIFNVINSRDIIPTFPLTDWGFTKYGTTLSVSMKDGNNWKSVTGKDNYVDFDVENTLKNFSKVCKTREEFYKMDKEASDTGRAQNNSSESLKKIRDDLINWTNKNASGQADIGEITGDGPYEFKISLMPTFTTSVIASLASTDKLASLGTLAVLTLAGLNEGNVSKYIAPVVNMVDGYISNGVVCGHCLTAYYGASSKVKYHTHTYGDPEFVKDGDTYKVVYECNECEDEQVILPEVTTSVAKEATLTETGVENCILDYIFNGEEYTKKIEHEIPRLEAKNFVDRIKQGDILTIVLTILAVLASLALIRFGLKLIFGR